MKRDILFPNKHRARVKVTTRLKQRSATSEAPLTHDEATARQRLQRELRLIRSARESGQHVNEFDVPEHARALDAAIEFVRYREGRTSARVFTYAPARARFALRYSNLGRLFLLDPMTRETLVASGYGCL
jgi:hypothetical protein